MLQKKPASAIESIVEEWLTKVPEVMCFTERMKVYAPTCHGKCEPEVNTLVNKLTDLFGGSTTYEACTGCWYDDDTSKVECEPARVVELAHSCSSKEDLRQMMEAIAEYAVSADQKALSIMNGHFYIAKKPRLIEKLEKESV